MAFPLFILLGFASGEVFSIAAFAVSVYGIALGVNGGSVVAGLASVVYGAISIAGCVVFGQKMLEVKDAIVRARAALLT